MLLDSNRAFVTVGNDVTLYTDGTKKFDDLLRAIRDAKDHIHMEYFILKDDGLGREIIHALEERAQAGVEVRLLVDGVGSAHLPRRFFRNLEKAGGKHAVFFPSLIPYVNYRVNYRNHRKIGVIDGKTAFIGGFNIGDDYIGKDPRWGYWRDCAVRIHGTGAYAAQLRFLLDWNYAAGHDSIEFIDSGELKSRYFPEMEHTEGVILQVVSGGPDTHWNAVKESYLKMINSATESVYLQTPYFIPDESITDALRIAALSGIDVRVMIPDQPDHMFVYWTSHSYVEELLDSGVRAYCYNNGFLHAKTIVIDGTVASVGSANWDMRSFHLNFETNAIMYNRKIAGELHDAFLDDLKVCTELTPEWYANKSWFFRTRASVCRLFTPVL